MGFQYGEQAAAHIDRTREDKWATALQRFRFTKRSSRRLAFVAAGVSNQMSICGGRP
jgi:hypothetical protein